MERSSSPPIGEKLATVVEFLDSNKDVLVEDLKDTYYNSIRQRFNHKGFYLAAFEGTIRMRMKENLRRIYTGATGINVEEGLAFQQEPEVHKLLEQIIDRSLK